MMYLQTIQISTLSSENGQFMMISCFSLSKRAPLIGGDESQKSACESRLSARRNACCNRLGSPEPFSIAHICPADERGTVHCLLSIKK